MSTSPARLPDRAPAPEEIVGLLADPLRRHLLALLDRTPRDLQGLVAASNGPVRAVVEQLGRLEAARVVQVEHGRYHLVEDVFARSVRDAASQRLGPLNDEHTQRARRYFYRNRLVEIPSDPASLETVLTLIAQDFQPGETYDEREVNTTLYAWNGDWARLRRLLVDHGYLRRDGGTYWRVRAEVTA
jgi:hypothetical protein